MVNCCYGHPIAAEYDGAMMYSLGGSGSAAGASPVEETFDSGAEEEEVEMEGGHSDDFRNET